MGTIYCILWCVREDQFALVHLHVVVPELVQCILFLHLGVVDMDHSPIVHQHLCYENRRSLTHITGIKPELCKGFP